MYLIAYVYISVHICIYLHVFDCICIYQYVSQCISIYMYLYVCICMYLDTSVCMYLYLCISECMCMYCSADCFPSVNVITPNIHSATVIRLLPLCAWKTFSWLSAISAASMQPRTLRTANRTSTGLIQKTASFLEHEGRHLIQ